MTCVAISDASYTHVIDEKTVEHSRSATVGTFDIETGRAVHSVQVGYHDERHNVAGI